MLPEVELRDVSREDVDRIAGWLEDEEVSSRWFGHYACGDPVHRGYDPTLMLEASEWEWNRVFHRDSKRPILSVYNQEHGHIGECQVILDSRGGAELSVLIGRKDLWRYGHGTSAVMALLDRVFENYKLDRAWVNVPEDNVPALGLFTKLGFVHEGTRELCERRDGTTLNGCILVMSAMDYRARQNIQSRRTAIGVVSITGLPGSGSRFIGEEIARMTGWRFIEDEIPQRMCRRLGRSLGELKRLEATYRSWWRSKLWTYLVSWEHAGAFGDRSDGLFVSSMLDYYDSKASLTKEEYLKGLESVVSEFVREGSVVLHGRGSHLYIPSSVPALQVYVAASKESRQRRIASDKGLSSRHAEEWLRRADRDQLGVYKHLFGSDLLDMGIYDLVLKMDRLPYETAIRTVIGALESTSLMTHEKIETSVF